MTWHSVEFVHDVPVNVYRCDACDKLAAKVSAKASKAASVRA